MPILNYISQNWPQLAALVATIGSLIGFFVFLNKSLNGFRISIKEDIKKSESSTDKKLDEFNSNCMGHVASTLAYMVAKNSNYSQESRKDIGAEILGISKDENAKEKVKTILDLK